MKNRTYFQSTGLFFLTLIPVFFTGIHISNAETAFEMDQQIQQEKKALEQIEAEIEKNVKETIASEKKERSLLTDMEIVDRRYSLLKKEATLLELEINKKEKEEKSLTARIKEVTLDIKKGKKIILGRVKSLYKEKQGASLKILFASRDYPDLLRKIQYVRTVAQKEEEILIQFKAQQKELENKNILLNEVVERMMDDREALAKKLVQSRTERKKKDRLLARIRKDRTLYKRAIVEMTEASKEIQALLKTLENKKEALSTIILKKFSTTKGQLVWPNNGKVAALFGRQKHPKFNETIYRKGIEIIPAGAGEVRSIFDGTVVYADWFRGYGMMVMIDHGENYYSLYAHLGKLLVGVGDLVKKGRMVGEVGLTGLSHKPKLYFEIRHQGAPTNPLAWLQKRR